MKPSKEHLESLSGKALIVLDTINTIANKILAIQQRTKENDVLFTCAVVDVLSQLIEQSKHQDLLLPMIHNVVNLSAEVGK